MTDDEKALMILEGLDEYIQVNWNNPEWHLKGIKIGLKNIKEKESNAATLDPQKK